MARPASQHPTELELEILKILWRKGPLSGREVRDALAPRRDLAYTSVMTIMKIMAKKKYLRRKKSGGSFIYHPTVAQRAVSQRMLGDLVDRVFDGSATAVMVSLLENADLHERELKELRQLINRNVREKSR
ncbi:MAG: BlaI/MecI/CopY family transcriptional regulator [Planctomycetota bacterium]|jgi:predicted transcriptional regulator